jgi:hypothetical protein
MEAKHVSVTITIEVMDIFAKKKILAMPVLQTPSVKMEIASVNLPEKSGMGTNVPT